MTPAITARTRLGPVNAEDRSTRGAASDIPYAPKPPGRGVWCSRYPFRSGLISHSCGWVVYSLVTAGNPGIIIAAPHLRLLQHALLLPLLLVFYRTAIAIGWPPRGRVRGGRDPHAHGRCLCGDRAADPAHARSRRSAASGSSWASCCIRCSACVFPSTSWTSSFSDFFLSYVLGLAILLGVKNYRELKFHQLRAANLQAAWTHSRLQALRMQLNPHFLFNTLNAAVSLVSSRPKVAEQMLVRLADLLRRTLRDGELDFITVRARSGLRAQLSRSAASPVSRPPFVSGRCGPRGRLRRGAQPVATASRRECRRS
ncbi:MAG: histidine kinase [Gammaproteobacteria bacterium]